METFTDNELQQLNEFAKGFTGDELKMMNLVPTEVIESLGSVKNYNTAQVTKGFEKIKSSKAVGSMTGIDLMGLGSFALGMSEEDITAMNTDSFG